MKRAISKFLLILLQISMFTLVYSISPVKAEFGDVYIRADGSVDPQTMPVSSVDNVTYVFTGDLITNGSFFVQRNNIVIDGAGYTLLGTEIKTGIHLASRNNITIRNMNVEDFGGGIRLDNSLNISIYENNITDNVLSVYSTNSMSISIAGNNITSKAVGVWLSGSSNNTVVGNQIGPNDDWGIIFFVSSNDNLLSGNEIRDNGQGIHIYRSTRNRVVENNVTGNSQYGVFMQEASHNEFHHNNFVNNSQQVYIHSSGGANTWDNGYPSGGNYWSGYIDVDDNSGPYQNITGVPDGIWDHPYEINADNVDHYPLKLSNETLPPAITVLSPENKAYAVNSDIPLTFTVDKPTDWIGFSLDGQTNTTITGNTTLPTLADGWHSVVIYANDTSGRMGASTAAHFAVDTTPPVANAGADQTVDEGTLVAFDGSGSSDNLGIATFTWTFTDETAKTLTGANPTYTFSTPGIYTVTLNVTDPAENWATNTVVITVLASELTHDVAITNVAPSKTVVGQGYSVNITVTAANQGDFAEIFNVTLYSNTTEIETREITLSSGNSTTFTFIWNTSGFAYGNYTISAYAWSLPGETNTMDNTLIDGRIFVTIPGDMDGDRDVDIFDIVRIAGVYGVRRLNPRYNPNCDIDGDGDIDIFDIVIAAGNYGKTW